MSFRDGFIVGAMLRSLFLFLLMLFWSWHQDPRAEALLMGALFGLGLVAWLLNERVMAALFCGAGFQAALFGLLLSAGVMVDWFVPLLVFLGWGLVWIGLSWLSRRTELKEEIDDEKEVDEKTLDDPEWLTGGEGEK